MASGAEKNTMHKKESKIQNEILSYLRKRKVCFALRTNAGQIVTHYGALQFAPEGMSDLVLFFPGAKVVFAEVKRPGQKLRSKQEQFKRFINMLHFPYVCVESVEQIERICNHYA